MAMGSSMRETSTAMGPRSMISLSASTVNGIVLRLNPDTSHENAYCPGEPAGKENVPSARMFSTAQIRPPFTFKVTIPAEIEAPRPSTTCPRTRASAIRGEAHNAIRRNRPAMMPPMRPPLRGILADSAHPRGESFIGCRIAPIHKFDRGFRNRLQVGHYFWITEGRSPLRQNVPDLLPHEQQFLATLEKQFLMQDPRGDE